MTMIRVSEEKKIKSIPFIDLKAQQERIRSQVEVAIRRVLDHGGYIMGPEVKALEKDLADFCGAKHVISCSNGTDALGLGLRALGVKPGDAIFVPSFTFAATAEVVTWMGATPLFIDSLEETYNMDPKSLEEGIQKARQEGLTPVGIIPVDLFGQPADYGALEEIAKAHQLWIMADGAQSFGGSYKGRPVGTLGQMTTTSFFPAKPLGCYGDGGAIFTNDDSLAEILRSLRVHGQGVDKYDNVRIGMNGRLDTIQAAILIEKLKIFRSELEARQDTAEAYDDGLRNLVHVPVTLDLVRSAWAQYTVRLPKKINREKLMDQMKEAGIPTMIYYGKPLHLQKAYEHYPTATGGPLPVCEALSQEVLSLPMSGYVSGESVEYIIQVMRKLC